MKKVFLVSVFFLIFLSSHVFAGKETPSCDKPNMSIKSKIDICNDAVKQYLTKENGYISKGSSIRSIEDFICLQDVPESRVFQIIMDDSFTKIDCDMEKYFQSLTSSKNLYFGKDAKFTYFDGINHIWEKSKYFKNLYSQACVSTLTEATKYVENGSYTLEEDRPSVSISEAKEYLKGGNGDCEKLLKVKIEIFNNVAFNVLQLNKAQVAKDQKKTFDQEQRTKYNKITDIMMINLSYIERIWMKWPSKIKNAL